MIFAFFFSDTFPFRERGADHNLDFAQMHLRKRMICIFADTCFADLLYSFHIAVHYVIPGSIHETEANSLSMGDLMKEQYQ